MRILILITLTALCFSNLPDAMAEKPQSPEAFLRGIYRPYFSEDYNTNPIGVELAPYIFDENLILLMRKEADTHPGEVGAIDSDLICDCQDFDKLQSFSITFKSRSAKHAVAVVKFVNLRTPTTITYHLTETKSGWRVSDISTESRPSLVAVLKKAIQKK